MTDVHVGVVGPDASGAATAVEAAEGRATAGSAVDVLDAGVDAVAALSESALYDLVRAGVAADTPVLPVDAGVGVPAVPAAGRDHALGRLVRGDYRASERTTLAVDARGSSYRAFADVMLTIAEAANISEYGITATGEYGEVAVDTVRADGVVVATPSGTRGYSRAANGPVVSPAVEAVTIVPIAPFRVERTDWVVRLPVTLTVERDEAPVSLLVDDRDVGRVGAGETVGVTHADPVRLAVTADAYGFFDW